MAADPPPIPETNIAAVTAGKSLDSQCDKTAVQVMVQLQRQEGDASTNSGLQRRAAVNIISHALDVDDTNSNNGSKENSKYVMCSLLLQIGKVLGVQPPYAPSPYISSIFNEILEKWSLQREGQNRSRKIDHLSEINEGDELFLCCGDYANDSPALASNNGVDLLALIPSKCNIVAVSLASDSLVKEGNTSEKGQDICTGGANDGGDDDSDIEDVTDLYTSKRTSRTSPEVIDLEDVSSDDDDDDESCFWEYDEYGNMRRSSKYSTKAAHSKSLSNSKNKDESESDASEDYESSSMGRNQDIESSDSNSSSDVEDVTEIMLAKRNEQVKKMVDDAEEINESDQDCADNQKLAGKKRKQAPRSPSTAKRRRAKKIESPIEVLIDEKDIPHFPGAKRSQDDDACDSSGGNTARDNKVDYSIKQRIVKLLNTGFHCESNEHEARNAMKLARRLMERYNLDQAVLLQERGDGSLNDFSTSNDNEGSTLQGGIVAVEIRNKKKDKPLSSLPRWNDFLIQPVCMNFHVEAFKTVARSTPHRAGACSVTFYGINTNAQLAAYAFKIASERIALMAATYEPPRKMTLSRTKQAVETRAARLSYALGVVKGLERDVKEGLRKEEERRKEKLRKAQRAAKTGEAHHEDGDSDSHEHDNSCFRSVHSHHDDFEEMVDDDTDQPQIGQDKTSCFNSPEHLGKLERENTAHLALVDHHKKIASEILKTKNIKVRTGRKAKSITLNRKAYEKGVIDSKEIDLNQQAIR
mmetsp:Transcript_17171/g.37061  ORF Transcript_17171/g.37061 Transcript_17171/m.37061 type:complete len:754 (-) Transcript_17171:209-2470(-)